MYHKLHLAKRANAYMCLYISTGSAGQNQRIFDLLFSLVACQRCDIVAGDVALIVRLGGFCHPPVALCAAYYLPHREKKDHNIIMIISTFYI